LGVNLQKIFEVEVRLAVINSGRQWWWGTAAGHGGLDHWCLLLLALSLALKNWRSS